MQIFQVVELTEFPYMELEEIFEGETAKDIMTEDNVYLIVDHDSKRIWTYNGPKSSLKLQVYGGILAGEMRKQLKLFYRIFFLNAHNTDEEVYQELMEKTLGAGRAKAIKKEDFTPPATEITPGPDLSVHPGLKASRAINNLNELPPLENFDRRFMIVGGSIYTDEETPEKVIEEGESKTEQIKLGQINRGFMFFGEDKYSLRLLVKERKIQGLELYVSKEDKSISETLNLGIPTFYEEKFSNVGSMETLLNSFEVPEKLPDEPLPEDQQPTE